MRYIFFCICILTISLCNGQSNYCTISSQGNTVKTSSSVIVTQSIGQQSVIGNQLDSSFPISSGYQKPFFFNTSAIIINDNSLKVYPNPFHELINIELTREDIYSITIFEFNGRVIYHESSVFIEENTTIELTDIKPGMYIIQLKGEHILLERKMIKL